MTFVAFASLGLLLSGEISDPAAAARIDPTESESAPMDDERRVVASDGAELHISAAGDGPPCLYVHGGPGQGSASFVQMGGSELEAFLTMIWMDQRGSGRSPDAADYSLDRVVQDMEEVRSALGYDQVCLIAHSFGGILAVEYARRHPSRVTTIVMAFSTLHFISEEADRMQIEAANRILGRDTVSLPPAADRAAVLAASDEARAALMASGQGYRFLTDNPDTTRRMSQVDRSYARSRGYGRAVLAQIGTDTEYYRDYAPVSASISQPVLVIAGKRDFAIGPQEHLRFRFPDQVVVEMDTGHLGYFDDNRAFIDAIARFMADRAAGSRSSTAPR